LIGVTAWFWKGKGGGPSGKVSQIRNVLNPMSWTNRRKPGTGKCKGRKGIVSLKIRTPTKERRGKMSMQGGAYPGP